MDVLTDLTIKRRNVPLLHYYISYFCFFFFIYICMYKWKYLICLEELLCGNECVIY